MARIKIKGKREVMEIENTRARQVKILRFGHNGVGKVDPGEDLDLGNWAGTVGEVAWVELDQVSQPLTFRHILKMNDRRAYQVPVDYTLQKGEEFLL